jgi:hypothetical protein
MATARKSTKATATKVEFAVINVGHAFIKGKGPNDKPKKDSLWGLLQAGDLVVKFFGRKGGAMRFKVADSLDEAQALYAHKLAGTDAKKLKHQDLSAEQQKGLLGDAWQLRRTIARWTNCSPLKQNLKQQLRNVALPKLAKHLRKSLSWFKSLASLAKTFSRPVARVVLAILARQRRTAIPRLARNITVAASRPQASQR